MVSRLRCSVRSSNVYPFSICLPPPSADPFCVHFVFILCSFCVHFVFILCSFCFYFASFCFYFSVFFVFFLLLPSKTVLSQKPTVKNPLKKADLFTIQAIGLVVKWFEEYFNQCYFLWLRRLFPHRSSSARWQESVWLWHGMNVLMFGWLKVLLA